MMGVMGTGLLRGDRCNGYRVATEVMGVMATRGSEMIGFMGTGVQVQDAPE